MESTHTEHEQTVTEAQKRRILSRYIRLHVEQLFRSLCVYVRKSGLARGPNVHNEASELMNEVVARALRHADRYDPSRQPMAWLLGIASNVILQERQRRRKHAQREPFLQDLLRPQSTLSVDELIARLSQSQGASLEERLASHAQAQHILAMVSEDDQIILRLSVIQQFSAKEIASQLGCTPGAARVRLFRALQRLRHALEQKDHELPQ